VTTISSKLILEQNDPFRKNTKSTIISKEFLPEDLKIATVVLVRFTKCERKKFFNAIVMGNNCGAHFPTSKVKTNCKK
jgi:hypothetical protein